MSAVLDETVYLVPSDATDQQVAAAFNSDNPELIERAERDTFKELGPSCARSSIGSLPNQRQSQRCGPM
jgi:hypothetical protein